MVSLSLVESLNEKTPSYPAGLGATFVGATSGLGGYTLKRLRDMFANREFTSLAAPK